MQEIAKFNEHLECPTIDGIIFANDTIQLLNVDVLWAEPTKFSITYSSTTSIIQIESEANLGKNSCAILDEYIDAPSSLKAICGEGNFGGDGFVSITDLKSGNTIWIAFFTSSNPFNKVNIVEGQVIADTTIGCTWKFNIDNPAVIDVQCSCG